MTLLTRTNCVEEKIMRSFGSMGSVYKVTLIGEGGVGKTSISVRYTEDRFDQQMKITIGVNFASKRIMVNGQPMTLMLWDLGGQPRFRDVISDYFVGTKLALAVYDATRYFSLERLPDWIDRLRANAPDADLLFVGNKVDERTEGEGVSLQEGQEFAKKYDAECVEVSAKAGQGVNEMFELAAKILFAKYESSGEPVASTV